MPSAVWSEHLHFGLVAMLVRLLVAARSKTTRFRRLYRKPVNRDPSATTASLPFKIAHYCSALETLFTTESTELAHKVSQRGAFFLGERAYDRWEIFSAIKNAYNIRSNLVHGDTLKIKQIDGLSGVSMHCNHYLRVILNCIFGDAELREVFDSDPGAIEEYFARLIGSPTP